MQAIARFLGGLSARLSRAADVVPPLFLRLILAWEYYESGITKLRGENWFGQIQGNFPFPFNHVPPDLSWAMATGFELAGAAALFLGLFTRFFAFSLIILTAVATAAVHWPMDWMGLGQLWTRGYDISDASGGNFKLPLIYLVMLLPLVFSGAGKLSLDELLCRWLNCRDWAPQAPPLESAALALGVLGISVVFVLAKLGLLLLALAVVILIAARLGTPGGRTPARPGD